MALDTHERSALEGALLSWYRAHRRALPWRESRDPYAIWVSEIMLQQTQVATVLPYFERWMARFPNVSALAHAEEADVLHLWQGLGYYSRARNLLAGARHVLRTHGGTVPRDAAALRALPGVGPYTAGAVASIAFGLPEPIVDGNVVRVLCRLFALRGDPARAPLKKQIWSLARELVPDEHAGDFNQALMELGATVCTPKQPACTGCPVQKLCAGRRTGIAQALPELAKRQPIIAVDMVAALVVRRDRVLVTQLPPDAPRWPGMWLFPNAERAPDDDAEGAARRVAEHASGCRLRSVEHLVRVRHSVTRYRITLDAYLCHGAERSAARETEQSRWCAAAELEQLAMPAAHRRLARRLEQHVAESRS